MEDQDQRYIDQMALLYARIIVGWHAQMGAEEWRQPRSRAPVPATQSGPRHANPEILNDLRQQDAAYVLTQSRAPLQRGGMQGRRLERT